MTTRTFLYTLPIGDTLPADAELAALPEGSPFLLTSDSGVALYAKHDDAMVPVTPAP